MAKSLHPIHAYRETDDGVFQRVGPEFASQKEFAAWVKNEQLNDVTFVPLRQVGKELTYKTETVGRVR